jgi:DNA-binding PadR family transcriptional regulator
MLLSMAKRTMQEATFLILTALAAGSQHGYGIITDVQAISAGRVQLKAGTLYAALERLRADRVIEVDREEIVDSRLRRYYRLTPAGGELLAAEAARLQANARVAMSRLTPAAGVVT